MRRLVVTGALCALVLCVLAAAAVAAGGVRDQRDALDAPHAGALASDSKCLICTVALTIAENELKKEDKDIVNLAERVCGKLGGAAGACRLIFETVGESAIRLLLKVENPSKICTQFKFCTHCHLQATNALGLAQHVDARTQAAANVASALIGMGLRGIPAELKKGKYNPWVDIDGDGFSPFSLHRGTDWRGRDCADESKHVHPGAAADTDANTDNNCNGVRGRAPTGELYETLLCGDADNRMLVTFGDSASSGFHIPAEWLDLGQLEQILREGLDEFDVPQRSWDSGFMPDINGESIYLRMLANNHCNHRQYANLGYNGAEMADLTLQVTEFNRTKPAVPALAFIAYIGNDVCAHELSGMTSVADYERQLLAGLEMLDAVAVKGTKVILMGLVDGRILWDTMHNRMHPLGVTYAQFYEYLTCSGVNPCNTWLTSNSTQRDLASKRAADLSDVLEATVASSAGRYSNIELAYEEFPLEEALQELEKEGRDPAELIEQVDGFHPSPYGHRLLSRIIWQHIQDYNPTFVSKVNPQNSKIESLFGNQGGF